MMQSALAFLLALLFALGLGISGMTRPSKVIGFLDVAGGWDPSLLFVMVGAIAVYATAYRVIMRRRTPLLAPKFSLPTKTKIDPRLAIGAVVFGVGWGLGGFCPGPSIVTLASGRGDAAVFVVAMVAGMLGYSLFEKLSSRMKQRKSQRRVGHAGSQGGAYAD